MLIFCSCVSLDWDNCQKLKAVYEANNKNNLIEEVDLDDPKTIVKQLKKEKQKQKHMEKQAIKRHNIVFVEDPNKDQDEISDKTLPLFLLLVLPFFSTSGFAPLSAPNFALSLLVSSIASRSGLVLFLSIFPSAFRSSLAFFLPVFLSASRFNYASFLAISSSASCSGPVLHLHFSFPISRFDSTSFFSHSKSISSGSPTFIGHEFFSIVFYNSFDYQQPVTQARRCSFLQRENYFFLLKKIEDDIVDLVKIPKKICKKKTTKQIKKNSDFN